LVRAFLRKSLGKKLEKDEKENEEEFWEKTKRKNEQNRFYKDY